jgi:multidrug efflux pump subunit AcrA (membrane-fusion protein)
MRWISRSRNRSWGKSCWSWFGRAWRAACADGEFHAAVSEIRIGRHGEVRLNAALAGFGLNVGRVLRWHGDGDAAVIGLEVHLAPIGHHAGHLHVDAAVHGDAADFAGDPLQADAAVDAVDHEFQIKGRLAMASDVDLDIVKVQVKVPEKYLRQLQIGRPLEFSVAAFPDEKFRGEVYFVSPQIDEKTRTALVKARIPNPQAKLRGGMFASLNLTLQLRDSAIVIPEPALMSNGDSYTVFVVDHKGTAQVRPIEVGERLAGKAEILKGLNAGEKVIVEGIQKLVPGSPVELAPKEAAAPYTQI